MQSGANPDSGSHSPHRLYFERLLASPDFSQAGRLTQLLRFLGENALTAPDQPLKETIIGVDVFGRTPGYDPKIDSIVRTEVRRLRLKLQEYYSGPGAADPIRIDIPKGAYQLVFINAAPTPAAPPATLPPTRRPVSRLWIVAALVVLALGSAALLALRDPSAHQPVAAGPQLITQSIGQALHPSLSANGEIVVYSYSDGDNSGIYSLRLDSAQPPRRLPGTRPRDFNPVVNPEGSTIAFLREENPTQFALLVQGVNEQSPQRWATVDRRDRVVWLPGNKQLIVSMRAGSASGPAVLMRIDATGARTVLTTPPPGTLYDGAPALSPDLKTLAFTRANDISVDEIFTVPLGPDFLPTAQPRQLTNEKRRFGGFCFSPTGAFVIASLQRGRSTRSLYRIPLDNPERIERVAEAGIQASYPTVAPAAKRIVYSIGTDDLNLYLINGAQPPVSVSPSATLDSSPSISPDGRTLAFRSARAGASEIWTARLDGSDPKRLTFINGPVTGSPRWSPNGQFIAYDTRLDGNADVYVVSADGKSNRRVTSLPTNEAVPSWSRDGRTIYYSSDQNGTWQIWKIPADGSGIARQITADGGFRAIESHDGAWLYYAKREPLSGLWRMPVSGGREEQLLPLQPSMWGGWAVSSSGIYWTELSPSPRIMFRPHLSTQTREITPIRNLPVHYDGSVDVTSDDAHLVFTQLDKAISDLYQIDSAQ